MREDASAVARAELFHDFDQRWRVVLQDADGEDLETILLPVEADGVRSALRLTREKLRERGLDVGELTPVDDRQATWEGLVVPLPEVA
jgi:hypothetical protein